MASALEKPLNSADKSSLLIFHILGGVGNQMFQYAAGRALSIARNLHLLLDVRDYTINRMHQGFELDNVFTCPVTPARPDEVHSVLGWQSSKLVCRILARSAMRCLRRRSFVVEPHFHYWEGFKNVPLPCYLRGNWQSERYFDEVEKTIRADFTFRQPLTDRNLAFSHDIKAVNSVSVHVRRGDYASNPKTLAFHGLCSLEYYKSAIQYMAERIKSPVFFLFSDDPEWVRANLNVAYPCHYVDHNHGSNSFKDMHLMSLCRHHIIANSSFSWWGAWLNPNPDKIVIAPRKWFADDKNVDDLFPPDWLTL